MGEEGCYVQASEFYRECVTEVCKRVQILHDICTRFGPYLHSSKCSWIINVISHIIFKDKSLQVIQLLLNLTKMNGVKENNLVL